MLTKQDYLLKVESKYPDSNIVLRHLQHEKVLVSFTLNNLHTLTTEQYKNFYLYLNYNDDIFLQEVDSDLYKTINDYTYELELEVKNKTNKSNSRRAKKKVLNLNLIQCFSLARITTEFYPEHLTNCIELTNLYCKEWRPLVWKKIESYLV